MDKVDEECIQEMRSKIVQKLDVTLIMDALVGTRVICDERRQVVLSQITQQEKARTLLDMLLKSDNPRAFEVFVSALSEPYPFLTVELVKKHDELYETYIQTSRVTLSQTRSIWKTIPDEFHFTVENPSDSEEEDNHGVNAEAGKQLQIEQACIEENYTDPEVMREPESQRKDPDSQRTNPESLRIISKITDPDSLNNDPESITIDPESINGSQNYDGSSTFSGYPLISCNNHRTEIVSKSHNGNCVTSQSGQLSQRGFNDHHVYDNNTGNESTGAHGEMVDSNCLSNGICECRAHDIGSSAGFDMNNNGHLTEEIDKLHISPTIQNSDVVRNRTGKLPVEHEEEFSFEGSLSLSSTNGPKINLNEDTDNVYDEIPGESAYDETLYLKLKDCDKKPKKSSSCKGPQVRLEACESSENYNTNRPTISKSINSLSDSIIKKIRRVKSKSPMRRTVDGSCGHDDNKSKLRRKNCMKRRYTSDDSKLRAELGSFDDFSMILRSKSMPSSTSEQIISVTLQSDGGFGFSFVSGRERMRWPGDDDYYISSLVTDGPAFLCKRIGKLDTIISVNGVPIKDLQNEQVTKLIKKEGNTVKLRIQKIKPNPRISTLI